MSFSLRSLLTRIRAADAKTLHNNRFVGIIGVGAYLCGFAIVGTSYYQLNMYAETTTEIGYQTNKLLTDDMMYGYTRNPMSIGIALVLVSIPLAFHLAGVPSSIYYLSFVPAIAWVCDQHFLKIPDEELTLESKFGAEYLDYQHTVPRWFYDFQSQKNYTKNLNPSAHSNPNKESNANQESTKLERNEQPKTQ